MCPLSWYQVLPSKTEGSGVCFFTPLPFYNPWAKELLPLSPMSSIICLYDMNTLVSRKKQTMCCKGCSLRSAFCYTQYITKVQYYIHWLIQSSERVQKPSYHNNGQTRNESGKLFHSCALYILIHILCDHVYIIPVYTCVCVTADRNRKHHSIMNFLCHAFLCMCRQRLCVKNVKDYTFFKDSSTPR